MHAACLGSPPQVQQIQQDKCLQQLSRSQQLRKITKPILEKKRRDRINRSLDELKDLILHAMNKDSSQHKLEKADILELTVHYLQSMQQASHKTTFSLESSASQHFQQTTGLPPSDCVMRHDVTSQYLAPHDMQLGEQLPLDLHQRLATVSPLPHLVITPSSSVEPPLPPFSPISSYDGDDRLSPALSDASSGPMWRPW